MPGKGRRAKIFHVVQRVGRRRHVRLSETPYGMIEASLCAPLEELGRRYLLEIRNNDPAARTSPRFTCQFQLTNKLHIHTQGKRGRLCANGRTGVFVTSTLVFYGLRKKDFLASVPGYVYLTLRET